jgi:hypothetical protein
MKVRELIEEKRLLDKNEKTLALEICACCAMQLRLSKVA